MHELGNCRRIIRLVEQELTRRGGGDPIRVFVRVGALSGVDTRELRELFPIAAKQTALEFAELIVETQPVRYQCIACDTQYDAKTVDDHCPNCGSDNTQLIGGTDWVLEGFECTSSA